MKPTICHWETRPSPGFCRCSSWAWKPRRWVEHLLPSVWGGRSLPREEAAWHRNTLSASTALPQGRKRNKGLLYKRHCSMKLSKYFDHTLVTLKCNDKIVSGDVIINLLSRFKITLNLQVDSTQSCEHVNMCQACWGEAVVFMGISSQTSVSSSTINRSAT